MVTIKSRLKHFISRAFQSRIDSAEMDPTLGLKHRPWPFYWMAAMLLATAVLVLAKALDFASLWQEGTLALTQAPLLSWVLFVSLLISAYAAWQASRALLVFTPIVLTIVFYESLTGATASFQQLFGLTVELSTISASLSMIPMFMPSSMAVLKDPSRRWWRASKRYHQKIAVTLNPYVGETIHTHTFDISTTGIFISLKKSELSSLPRMGDKVRLIISVDTMRKIRCEAIVVRIAEPLGSYPTGMGLRFAEFEKGHEKNLYQFLQD